MSLPLPIWHRKPSGGLNTIFLHQGTIFIMVWVIIFKCKKCGKIRKNKAAKDDNMDLIIKLSAKH